MKLVANEDEKAFGILLGRYTGKAGSMAARIVGEKEAQDVTQEAFLKVWNLASSFKEDGNFKAWLYRIIYNLAIDNYRKNSKEVGNLDEETPDSSLNFSHTLEMKDFAEKALSHLPARQKAALQLCYMEGYSQQEAADIMGTTVSALETLLFRGRQSVKSLVLRKLKEQ